ncbi:MAG: phosphoenolpyruvate carboxykinase (GTP) [Opitutales bacterium]|nr:phosphoenolpyruvate carboxykinase (GTP) [Opitutales bacterium]
MSNKFSGVLPHNRSVLAWVDKVIKLCEPAKVHWCDGSEEEKDRMYAQAVDEGLLIPLNQEKRPGCYLHRSNPNDVARVEGCTYICTESRLEAGPTNNWEAPDKMYEKLYNLAQKSMQGRTLYVVPYLMGPPGCPLSKVGVEITDSLYVVLNMRIMTRMGQVAWDELGNSRKFNRGLHCMLEMDPKKRYIAHFPQDNMIISVGSAYGGNALLGKKCHALRIGSYLGRQQDWMAEHMLILGVESPEGKRTYVAGAFPSACGKTNFSMLIPPKKYKGWKIWTVGDDIAWMWPKEDGRLWAINPEAGYFGVAPGTSESSNPNAMSAIQKDTIFTNVALTEDGDVWWEGMDGPPPEKCIDWKGREWTPESSEPAAHPNSRFTAPMKNNPAISHEVDNPEGVPISAVIFGGRRKTVVPLVFQAFEWIHGVYLGATMGSETTAAAEGVQGNVRRDPMAMKPFCGYNMGDYFHHWLQIGKKLTNPPRIFHVNWFRRDSKGKFLWPGFGENMRVLRWIIDRCHGTGGIETALGWMPRVQDMDIEGLPGFDEKKFHEVQHIDTEGWIKELLAQEELFLLLHDRIPKELVYQRQLVLSRL